MVVLGSWAVGVGLWELGQASKSFPKVENCRLRAPWAWVQGPAWNLFFWSTRGHNSMGLGPGPSVEPLLLEHQGSQQSLYSTITGDPRPGAFGTRQRQRVPPSPCLPLRHWGHGLRANNLLGSILCPPSPPRKKPVSKTLGSGLQTLRCPEEAPGDEPRALTGEGPSRTGPWDLLVYLLREKHNEKSFWVELEVLGLSAPRPPRRSLPPLPGLLFLLLSLFVANLRAAAETQPSVREARKLPAPRLCRKLGGAAGVTAASRERPRRPPGTSASRASRCPSRARGPRAARGPDVNLTVAVPAWTAARSGRSGKRYPSRPRPAALGSGSGSVARPRGRVRGGGRQGSSAAARERTAEPAARPGEVSPQPSKQRLGKLGRESFPTFSFPSGSGLRPSGLLKGKGELSGFLLVFSSLRFAPHLWLEGRRRGHGRPSGPQVLTLQGQATQGHHRR
ncbi:uncharacterized protein LOC114670339 isoform X1 [Macaca mulatta]